MISTNTPPDFPAGAFQPPGAYDSAQKAEYVSQLRNGPSQIRNAVDGLDDEQLDTPYKNWTLRQIVHHLADSHMNAYIRFKWALTEDSPLIKSYDETKWSDMAEAKTTPLEPSLLLLDGLHARWCRLVESLEDAEMNRTFFHPEQAKIVSLWESLPSYVWHTRHHVAQINWVRDQQGW